jgi:hypothetical protein
MTRVAWPERSVRPYESLLILMRRFLWLNQPEPQLLARSLQISTYDLTHLDLLFQKAGRRDVDLSALRNMLRMNSHQWWLATLHWETAGNLTYSEMRFCPQCLESAYHAAIFQLRTIAVCPEHHCELISGCPHCGNPVPTVWVGESLRSPFTCLSCKGAWTRPETSIDPPRMGCLLEIGRVARWYQWAADVPRIETRPVFDPNEITGEIPIQSPAWPFLELAGGKPAPPLVNVDRELLIGAKVKVTKCGLPVCSSERKPEDYQPLTHSDKGKRAFALYRAYLRHLKKQLRDRRWLLRAFIPPSPSGLLGWHAPLGIPRTAELDEAKIFVFAVILFRFTIEHWASIDAIYRRRSSMNEVALTFTLNATRCVFPMGAASFVCSPAERGWLVDHFLIEGLQSIFDYAVCHAREMVRTGYYFLVHVSNFYLHSSPHLMGKFDSEGQVEFWSMRLPEDLERCRTIQRDWRTSAPIYYKEEPVESENRTFSGVTPDLQSSKR